MAYIVAYLWRDFMTPQPLRGSDAACSRLVFEIKAF